MDAVGPLQKYLEDLNQRLQTVEEKLSLSGPVQGSSAPTPTKATAAASVMTPGLGAYDEFEKAKLTPFLDASKALGSGMQELAEHVQKAFAAQRVFLVTASQCQKPVQTDLMRLLLDLQTCMRTINGMRDNRSDWANHQNMINEGIQGLGWLCVEPAPVPYIESYIGGSDFWGNKIRVQYKATEPKQITLVQSFNALLKGLMAYVKEHHKTGVEWNPAGGKAAEFEAPAASASTPPPAATAVTSGKSSAESVFAGIRSIDQSGGKTQGLRKVTKDMQTWRKEYKAKDGAPAPKASAPKAPAAKAKAAEKPDKPPVCELRGGSWAIENQGGPGTEPLLLKDVNLKQQIYIYNCTNATIIIEGKVKTITMDKCVKSKLIFDKAVSTLEIVNCKRVQAQCKQSVPSIILDKTDGCLLYVSYEGRDCKLVTSKSSEMNIQFPESPDSEEYVEVPIPEQFFHTITKANKLTSVVSDLYT